MNKSLLGFIILLLSINLYARQSQRDALITISDNEPTTDLAIGLLWQHSNGTQKVLSALNPSTWITVNGGSGGGIPSGLITFVDSGSCASGWSEIPELNGVTLVGTVAANANVGTTGGNDNITPSGTIGALTFTGSALATHNHTFTGNALATHQHELPFQKVAGGTGVLRMIASSVFGVGTSRAAESQSAAPVANTTSAAVLRDQPISAGTPSGTNTAISAGTPAGTINTPAFTGTQFDNRSSFKRVIFCRKD